MKISQIIDLHQLALAEAQKYPLKRDVFPCLTAETGRHSIGIAGPKGVGKTILLRQFAAENKDAFYISADTLDADVNLFDLVRTLSETLHYRTFLLDEIHFLRNPVATLKRMYDFLDVRIVFTSSVALALQASVYDLSRRTRILPLYPFSYREYLRFAKRMDLPPLSLRSLTERSWQTEHARAGSAFESYLCGGSLPFALGEPDPMPLLANMLEKIIMRDIPSSTPLAMDELDTIRRLMKFVGRSAVDGINYSSLSQNLGITKYKAEQYVTCLEKAFVLKQVFPAGTNVLREPKILMTPPFRLLYRDYDEAIGGLREDYFVEMLRQGGASLQYLKTTRGAKTPDYLVELDGQRLVIEIGGPGKGHEQFKGVQADRKLVLAHTDMPTDRAVPLFLAGFLPAVTSSRNEAPEPFTTIGTATPGQR